MDKNNVNLFSKINNNLFKVFVMKDYKTNFFLLSRIHEYLSKNDEVERQSLIIFIEDELKDYHKINKEELYDLEDGNEVEISEQNNISFHDIALKKYHLFLRTNWLVSYYKNFIELVEEGIYTSYLYDAFKRIIETNDNEDIDLITPLKSVNESLQNLNSFESFSDFKQIEDNFINFKNQLNETSKDLIRFLNETLASENLSIKEMYSLIFDTYQSIFSKKIKPLEEGNRAKNLIASIRRKLDDFINDEEAIKQVSFNIITSKNEGFSIDLNNKTIDKIKAYIDRFNDEYLDSFLPQIARIYRKDEECLSRAIARINFLENNGKAYKDLLLLALKGLEKEDEDKIYSFKSNYFKVNIINSSSLYVPKKRVYNREFKKLVISKKEISKLASLTSEQDNALYKEQAKYSKKNIYIFADYILSKYPEGISLLNLINSELKEMEEVSKKNELIVKTFYLFLYEKDEGSRYNLSFLKDVYSYKYLNDLSNYYISRKEEVRSNLYGTN